MRLVLALGGAVESNVTLLRYGHRDFLASFAYPSTLEAFDVMPEAPPRTLIIDSGAFTAWTKGIALDVREYAQFALGAQQRWPQTVSVNLDVIPGSPGRTSTAAEREEGMERSLIHADVLRAHGLRVMEVFHQDEPLSFLKRLVERRRVGEPLGLSPRNDRGVQPRCAWLRHVLKWMVQHGGVKSIPPCHGLAATAASMGQAFPFYSADSSTWSLPFRVGFLVPQDTRKRLRIAHLYGSTGSLKRSVPEEREALYSQVRSTIRHLQAAADQTTALWAQRGIEWQDDPISQANT